MTREQYISNVKARMDELNPFTAVELNSSISLIDNLLDESTKTILMVLPLYLIQPTAFPTTSLVITGRTGNIELPADFLRLHSFKMTGWATEVSEAISTQHTKYKLQKYDVTMGGTYKPVVVIKSDDAKVNKKLYYYSLETGATHTVDTALYIKSDLPQNLSQNDLADFIAWQCASDVFLAMEDVEASNAAKVKLAELITIKTI